MKKIIILCSALLLFVSLAACSKQDDNTNKAGFDAATMFQANVIEVNNDYLIVEPLKDYAESKSSDRIKVSVGQLTLDDEIEVGDTVEVYYEGGIQETYPAVAEKVVHVKVIVTNTVPTERPIQPSNPYNSLVAWVNWSEDVNIVTKSLNFDKMSISSVRHLPIYMCESANDLDGFKNQFKDSLSLSSSYDEAPSFEEVTVGFGADFFNDNTLFLVYVSANSGSLRFALDSFSVMDGTFRADIIQTNNPEVVTDDTAGWLIVVPVSNDQLEDVQNYDAVMN